jgi:3-oxoacyl-[acyl-carrier-protein] synthase-3
VNDLIDYAGISLDDVDYFLFHQANNMINNTIKKKLKLDDSRVPMSLEDFGNTSGATIPVTMTVRLGDVISDGKNKLLMCGFGVGLSWGSCLIDVENVVVSSLIEV